MSKFFRDFRVFGITAVGISTGRLKLFTEVLTSACAKFAITAGRINPGNAHTLADLKAFGSATQLFNDADNLVSRNNRSTGRRCPAFNFIQLGVAHTTGGHPNQNLVVIRFGHRNFNQLQRTPVFAEAADTV